MVEKSTTNPHLTMPRKKKMKIYIIFLWKFLEVSKFYDVKVKFMAFLTISFLEMINLWIKSYFSI